MMENYEKKQQEKKEMQDAGAKTAHVAGKAAASYFGGTIGNVAYDKISQTKLGQGIEQGVGKVISKVPGVNKLNKKLNDAGVVDAADKAVDLVGGKGTGKATNMAAQSGKSAGGVAKPNGQGGGKLTGGNSTPKALSKDSRGSRLNSLHNQRKLNNRVENKNNNLQNNENDSEEQEDKTGVNEFGETKDIFSFGFTKYKRKVLLVLIGGIGIFGVILIMVIAGGAWGSLDTLTSPIVSLNSDEDETKNHYYDSDNPELLKEEINFNNNIVGSSDGSISGILADYQKKYGVILDTYVLEATLLYRYPTYYQLQLNNMSEEEYDSLMKSNPDFHRQVYDFGEATKYITTVADLMISSNGDSYYSDVSKNGEYYNKLLQSSFLTNYYSSLLAYEEYSDPTKLVDEIFDYAEYLRFAIEGNQSSQSVISDTINVHLQTCSTPYKYKTFNNIKVFDNPAATTNEAEAPSIVSLLDYGVGALYGEVSGYAKQYANGQENLKEGLKALAVASYSFMLGKSSWGRSGLDLKGTDLYIPTGNCRLVCCNPTTNSNYSHYNGDKYGTCMSTTSSTANHPALNEQQLTKLRELVSEVFGEVMVEKGVTAETFSGSKDIKFGSYYDSINNKNCGSNCLGQKESIQDSINGMTYREILAKYYDSTEYDLINIQEGLYLDSSSNNYNYNGQANLNENFHYYQFSKPWSEQNLCDSGPISSNGCNITAVSMAISILKSQRLTPDVVNQKAKGFSSCKQASRPQMIMDVSRAYGLKVTTVNKDNQSAISDMLQKLSTGSFVAIARLAPNAGRYKSNSGHYITLVGVQNTNGVVKTLVWDPGSSSSKRDNYWANFQDDILKYTNSEYSFILIGR